MIEIAEKFNVYALDYGYSAVHEDWSVDIWTHCHDDDTYLPDDQWLRRCWLMDGERYVAAAWEYGDKPPAKSYANRMCRAMDLEDRIVPDEIREALLEIISREP